MIRVRTAISAAICLVMIVLSWEVFAETTHNLWIRGLANRLEAKTVGTDVLASRADRWQALAGVSSCGSDTLYSALVVVLRKLDLQNISQDYAEWARNLGAGESFLNHMSECLPTDGNAVLRLAMVKRSIAENSAQICNLIALSRFLAPNEALVISARMSLYNRLSDRSRHRCVTSIRADVRTILAHGRRTKFNSTLLQTRSELRQIVRSEFVGLATADKRWARREFSAFMDLDGTAGQ